jgi:hypothetical protein
MKFERSLARTGVLLEAAAERTMRVLALGMALRDS